MIKKILIAINTIYIIISKKIIGNKNTFFFVKFKASESKLNLNNSTFEKSTIDIVGKHHIEVSNSLVSNSAITIRGQNNKLRLEENVKLRGVTIHIRGENCTIAIGNNTSFEGARIVNVGINNTITIGKDCMFSDNIEIWASDTHSIFNDKGELVNEEKPVVIGDNVWVGAYVKILKGVTVGKGSVIGMNTLVLKDISQNSVYAGNPAKQIQKDITWSLDYKGI